MRRITQIVSFICLGVQLHAANAGNQANNALHSPADIQQQVLHYLQQQTQGQKHFERIEVKVNNLDPRLRLKRCQQPLQLSSTQYGQLNNRQTVKVACKSGQPWTIFVSARILAYAKILVAAEPLVRGQIINASQLQAEVRPYKANKRSFNSHGQLIGMQLKRSLSQGEAILSHHIVAPKVVKRGDEVILAALLGSTQISTEGTALTDGKIGEQIRVKNNRSQRIIKARVTAPGKVEVIL